jgi:RimJ/RimL family protein N-acetyltransferase
MSRRPLFENENLRITSIDLDKDSQVISSWTYDLDIARRLREEPARPMPVFEVKKVYEKWQKEVEENKQFLFAIRRKGTAANSDEPVIGVLRIAHIAWVHGAAYLDLVIGNPQDWKEFAQEALEMALYYAFDELGLFRVTAVVAEHNQNAHDLFEQANFTLEVRQRQALYWNKRSWDKLFFGLLRPEWKMQQMAEVSA